MKKTVIIVVGLLLCAAAVTVIGQKKVLSPKEERREVREKRRAERIANYEKFMDSLVPYYVTIINYTVSDLQGYITEQTHEGWMVTFSTSLFSASTYTFTFEIFSRTGGATLTITNPWYNPVQYTGSISQLY